MYPAALDVLSRGTPEACGRLRPQRSSVSRYPSVQPTLQRLPHVLTLMLHVDLKHSPQAKMGYPRIPTWIVKGPLTRNRILQRVWDSNDELWNCIHIKSQMPKDWKRFGHILVLSTRYSKQARDFNLDQVGISTHFNSKEKEFQPTHRSFSQA